MGVRRSRLRHRIVGSLAFALAIAACGLTSAMWLRALAPVIEAAHLF